MAAQPTPYKLTKKKKEIQKQIETDLKNQLEDNQVFGKHYDNLVDDYLKLYEIKEALLHDIQTRGVSIQYNNGGGQSGYKKNDSVPELIKINGQMLKILSELGLKPVPVQTVDDDGEI